LLFSAIDDAEDVINLVLWLRMLPGDDPEAAQRAAFRFSTEPRAMHFWEDEGWPFSTRLRHVLGIGPYDPARSAWDVYLFYDRGIEWGDGDPPAPTSWAYNTLDDLPGAARLSGPLVHDWLRE
jgi:hypothetical protein